MAQYGDSTVYYSRSRDRHLVYPTNLRSIPGGPYSAAAIAAGVSLMLTPNMHAVLGGAGMLSPAGRCHTLDAAADGQVPPP